MGFEITDGTGKGYSAGVDSTNRLLTSTINETSFEHAAESGDAYFIGIPVITLTTTATSAIFYLQNNEDRPLNLGNFFIFAEGITGGTTNSFRVNFHKNPTTIGTIFSATTALNQNFGSSNELDAVVYYGAQGSGVSGGTIVAQLALPTGQFNNVTANLVLEKGNSFAVSITPVAGTTNLPIQFSTRTILFTRN